jgi:hypothetical protein
MGDYSGGLGNSHATAGTVAWLRKDAALINESAFRASGLHENTLGLPVLIFDALTEDHPYVWICLVRSSHVATPKADQSKDDQELRTIH